MKFVIKKNPAARQPYYFIIKADNGQTLLTSEMYVGIAGVKNAIRAVSEGIATATVQDLTGDSDD